MPNKPLPDFVRSLIRTWVPIITGSIIAFLANLGFDIDAEALFIVVNGLIIGLLYLGSRLLENVVDRLPIILKQFAKIILLATLGSSGQPSYQDEGSFKPGGDSG